MDDRQQIQQEKRETRRRRRIRNQIMSYMAVFLVVAVAAVGILLGARQLTADRGEGEDPQQSNQDALNDLLGEEESLQTPEPTPEPVPELTPEQKLDDIVNAGIEVMPLEDKVAGLFIVTPEAITGVSKAIKAGEGTQKALDQYPVGGLIYSGKNIQSGEQFQEMLDNTGLYAKYPLFLAVKEEGGSVSVVAELGIATGVDAPEKLGQAGDTDAAYQAGVTLGQTLSGLGINLNLAPSADVLTSDSSFLKERSFGSDAQLAGSMAAAVMNGMNSQKVTACVKHFPGMGSTSQDPEKGLSSTDRTEEQFRAQEFVAFQTAIDSGAKMIMVSNMAAPALTGDESPCVFSDRLVTDILRVELGFDGVIITDALDMKAISEYYGSEQAAVQALKAGCDMILMPENFEEAYNGVLQAVRDGVISEERIDDALRRIYRIKYADRIE